MHANEHFTRRDRTKVNHVYITLYTRVHDSSYVSKWLKLSNPLRHRYGRLGVTPHPNVIAIYRTGMY